MKCGFISLSNQCCHVASKPTVEQVVECMQGVTSACSHDHKNRLRPTNPVLFSNIMTSS